MNRYIFTFLMSLFFSVQLNAGTNSEYSVLFTGIKDDRLLNLLSSVSELVELSERPPKTETGLKRRVEDDIPSIVKALHSQAYYNAKVDYSIDFEKAPNEVTVEIDTGPVYPLASYSILPLELNIEPQQIGICLGRPAIPGDILQAQQNLLLYLERKGYPLAKIEEFEAVADQKSKQLHVTVHVTPGPLATFGPLTIEGCTSVRESFIRKKIAWKRGEIYNPEKVERTLEALEAARLFSSISVFPEQEVLQYNQLPMTIALAEGKQRTIGFGLGYSTQRGPGITAEWEHRNLRGKGERMRILANLLQHTQDGIVSYVIPDFKKRGQDLVWAAEVEHDYTKGYEKTSFLVS